MFSRFRLLLLSLACKRLVSSSQVEGHLPLIVTEILEKDQPSDHNTITKMFPLHRSWLNRPRDDIPGHIAVQGIVHGGFFIIFIEACQVKSRLKLSSDQVS